jgi:hypothetical protein
MAPGRVTRPTLRVWSRPGTRAVDAAGGDRTGVGGRGGGVEDEHGHPATLGGVAGKAPDRPDLVVRDLST